MKIAITSQNFRTITGHAGKTRRFLVFEVHDNGNYEEQDRLDLPKEMSLHAFHGEHHPLFDMDVVITAGCGRGFHTRMQQHGVSVVETGLSDPLDALQRFIKHETLPPPQPHEHEHATH